MNNNIIFQHNFCESRIQDNQAPELYNAYSSLFICIIPLFIGNPNNIDFKNIRYMFILNGFFSFYYHYSLSWFGKQLDEITMILATYYGIRGLLQFYPAQYENKMNMYNTCIMPVFIAFNTLPQFDFLFPHLFTIYILYVAYLIYDIGKKHYILKTAKQFILVSIIGASMWIISENFCNKYTTYGHILWHFLFPYGMYNIVILYDDLINNV